MSALSLTDLIIALKHRYPDSTLVTELLNYQDGHYAVRAMVNSGSTILATGMAADPSIEAAEDRAKIRAIQSLAMPSESTITPTSPHPTPFTDAEPGAKSKPVPKPKRSQTTQPTQGDDRNTDIEISADIEADSEQSSPVSEEQDTSSTSPDLLDPSVAPTEFSIQEEQSSETNADDSAQPSGNVNFLDQIAKTDVEMRRLGWNASQGRQILQERYGKRSRQELTDEEVLDFLSFLEQHP